MCPNECALTEWLQPTSSPQAIDMGTRVCVFQGPGPTWGRLQNFTSLNFLKMRIAQNALELSHWHHSQFAYQRRIWSLDHECQGKLSDSSGLCWYYTCGMRVLLSLWIQMAFNKNILHNDLFLGSCPLLWVKEVFTREIYIAWRNCYWRFDNKHTGSYISYLWAAGRPQSFGEGTLMWVRGDQLLSWSRRKKQCHNC